MKTKCLISICVLAAVTSAASKTYAWGNPPVADLSVDRYVCVGSSVRFDACLSHDPDACPCTGCPLTACPSCGLPLRSGIRLYEFDWTNDGVYDYSLSAADGSAVYHAYETAGNYTVKLRVWDHDSCVGLGPDKSGTCTRLVSAVGVDGIYVMPHPATEWLDVTESTIVVLKGARYTFKALPYPVDASWPFATPVWSGMVSGAGQTIDVPFNNVGTQYLMAGCRPIEERRVTIDQVLLEPDEVSFLDYYAGDEHDIYGVSDPVWKRVSSPYNPACYTKYKFLYVGGKFWAPLNLTYSTPIYVDLEDQPTGCTFLSNEITVKNWPSARSDHRSTERLPNQIGSQQYTFIWKYRVPSGTNQWIDMANTSGPHKVYRVFEAPKAPEASPKKYILDYACTWADSATTKAGACAAILSGGFSSHYNWNYNCNRLASDFVRLVSSLGVSASENRWAAGGSYFYSSDAIGVGDMVGQRTRTIDPVGTYGSANYVFGFHEWSQAENNQYDPTTAYHLDTSSWGDYEDDLFIEYKKRISVSPIIDVWVSAQPGQSSGCEAPSHRHYESDPSEVLEPWLGP